MRFIYCLLGLFLAVPAALPSRAPDLRPVLEPEPIKMSPERLAAALSWAKERMAAVQELEKAQANRKQAATFSAHYSRMYSADPEVQKRARRAQLWVEVARAPDALPSAGVPARTDDCSPPQAPSCDFSSPYRRHDGACNHPTRPLWGASDTPLVRLEQHTFDSLPNHPRATAVDGDPLPSARLISQRVTRSKDEPNNELTLSLVNWGQFMDHDITLSPQFVNEEGGLILCCQDGDPIVGPSAHPQCMPIEIPSTDPFYSQPQRNQRCMDFVRSVPALPPSCTPVTPTITENVLTAYIDGSAIYGSNDARVMMTRSNMGDGRLKIQGDNLLPPDNSGVPSEVPCFSDNAIAEPCFLAGDVRVNEQTGLTVMHTIWMREHNRIADRLAELNGAWDDERLFQEARKIVGAEIQHITYNEWLPIILGQAYMDQNNIGTQSNGYSDRYIEDMNPTIATEFSTACFRFGHTLIQGELCPYDMLVSPPPATCSPVRLRDVFFDPHLIYAGRLDDFAKGMVTQPPQTFDANIARELTEFLFKEDGNNFGMDLIALNIQRGRDHGIPTYNTMREYCQLGRAQSFDDLENDMPTTVVNRLRQVYDNVDDIDLFIGAVSENVFPGATVGPTIRCVVGNQFIRLRWGDNFFYDLGGAERPWKFTPKQLKQLKNASWARILCDNIDSITKIQRHAFMAPNGNNGLKNCKSLKKVRLGAWAE